MKYRGGKEGREKEQIEVRGKGGLRCVCVRWMLGV